MILIFKNNLSNVINNINNKNILIAICFNSVIYIDNNQLNIKTNKMHYIYINDCWYARNNKTNINYYLGKGASPTINFDELEIKNAEILENILLLDENYLETEKIKKKIEIAKLEQWFVEYDRICNEHARCQRMGIECHHNIEEYDIQAVENAKRLKELRG